MLQKIFLAAFIASFFVGCSDNNDSPATGAAESNLHLGLWVLSPRSDTGGEDTSYLLVRKDSILYYFYQGSDAENSRNCYITEVQALKHVQGNRYIVGDGTNETTITATETTLTFEFVDVEDDDGDGDTSEIIVESIPRAIGISELDLLICE